MGVFEPESGLSPSERNSLFGPSQAAPITLDGTVEIITEEFEKEHSPLVWAAALENMDSRPKFVEWLFGYGESLALRLYSLSKRHLEFPARFTEEELGHALKMKLDAIRAMVDIQSARAVFEEPGHDGGYAQARARGQIYYLRTAYEDQLEHFERYITAPPEDGLELGKPSPRKTLNQIFLSDPADESYFIREGTR